VRIIYEFDINIFKDSIVVSHELRLESNFTVMDAINFRKLCRAQALEDFSVFRRFQYGRYNGLIVESGALVSLTYVNTDTPQV
jgi:hypothetical protein